MFECYTFPPTWHRQDVEQVVSHQELHLLALLGTLALLVSDLRGEMHVEIWV